MSLKLDPAAEELFKSDRDERKFYEGVSDKSVEVPLPITRDGFEAMLEAASKFAGGLPLHENVRSAVIGFIHHIDNSKDFTTLGEIAVVIRKQHSNALTWVIDQEIKEAVQVRRQEAVKQLEAEAQEKRRQEKIQQREMKQASKAGQRVTIRTPDENKAS